MLKCKVCVLVADRLLARVKMGDISRCPGEPPYYFDKRFSKVNSLDNQLLFSPKRKTYLANGAFSISTPANLNLSLNLNLCHPVFGVLSTSNF